MIIIDGENLLLGRMSSKVAKKSLEGEEVVVVNCEKVVVSGKEKEVIQEYKQKESRGVHKKGPFIPKMPDRFVRRTIRGMIPYKKPRGREAYERVMCYIGVPEEYEGEAETIPDAKEEKLPKYRFVSVGRICESIGGKNYG